MRILLLAGGESSEREISLTSGASVHEALKRLGHDVLAIDPLSGSTLLNTEALFVDSGKDGQAAPLPTKSMTMSLAEVLHRPDFPKINCVFVALHGGTGENGSVQSLLQLAGVKFTGSSMAASAIAMDKAISKRLMQSVEVQTPEFELVRSEDMFIEYGIVRELSEKFKLPLIVKPNDSGSTVGLTRVDEIEDLHPAMMTAREESPNILVEEYIAGREMTVSVLNGKALPVVEIIPESGLYDYEAKYTKGKSTYVAPAKIHYDLVRGLQKAAEKVYEVIGVSGLARVDFILRDDGQFFCLELNTLPGMTDLSLSPMAAKAAHIEFDDLIQQLIDNAYDPKVR